MFPFFTPSFGVSFFLLLRVQFFLAEKETNRTWRNTRESHVNRTLYLHGPSQCKIEIFINGNTYKKAIFHWTFSLNITLVLFTSLQCIQNTLLVTASSQTDKYGRFWSRSKGGREQKRKVSPSESEINSWPFEILNICVKGLVMRVSRALLENEPWQCR